MDPRAQQSLRAAVRDEIKERKGKGKGKGKNKKSSPEKKAVTKSAASSRPGQDGDRTRGKLGKQGSAKAGKGNAASKSKNGRASSSSRTATDDQEQRALGCPTCRFAKKGCHICKRPGYKPRGPNRRSNPQA